MKAKKRIKKQSKLPLAKLQRNLWLLCKEIIRKKYGNECYTCDRKGLSGSNWHTSHFIPKSTCGAFLKYDLRNLRPGCYHCNINLGGNGAIFMKNMILREGADYVEGIFRDRNVYVNPYEHYTFLTEKYKLMLEEINAT